MSSPTGIVKVPISGCEKPMTILSKTEQAILGVNRTSTGKGALNSIRVLSVGSEPAIFGSVLMLSRLVPRADGTIDLRLN